MTSRALALSIAAGLCFTVGCSSSADQTSDSSTSGNLQTIVGATGFWCEFFHLCGSNVQLEEVTLTFSYVPLTGPTGNCALPAANLWIGVEDPNGDGHYVEKGVEQWSVGDTDSNGQISFYTALGAGTYPLVAIANPNAIVNDDFPEYRAWHYISFTYPSTTSVSLPTDDPQDVGAPSYAAGCADAGNPGAIDPGAVAPASTDPIGPCFCYPQVDGTDWVQDCQSGNEYGVDVCPDQCQLGDDTHYCGS
jgi:hypothetical protein